MGRRRCGYWILDALLAIGRNDLSAPLVELAGRYEIWETICAKRFIVINLDVFSTEIRISEFTKLLNNSLQGAFLVGGRLLVCHESRTIFSDSEAVAFCYYFKTDIYRHTALRFERTQKLVVKIAIERGTHLG